MNRLLLLLVFMLMLSPFAQAAESPAKSAAASVTGGAMSVPAASVPAQSLPAALSAARVAPPDTVPQQAKPNKMVTISMFLAVIAATVGIVVWAAKRTKTATDFYAAGGGITGMQNGWAIAGDFMSAGTFLGITGLVTIFGVDGAMYAVGPVVSFVTILLLIAEPLRNAGKYTVGDILSLRSSSKAVRTTSAVATLALSIFYLLPQIVGAGKLMQLLLDIPYRMSVIGIGVLITLYVTFGGMKATTWVQIIKAVLLVGVGIVLSFITLWKSGLNPVRFFQNVTMSPAIQDHVQALLKHPVARAGFDYGQRFLEPGLFLKDPTDQVSLGLNWLFGAAGLPHIMMRFFTVPNAKAARKSVIVSMFIIAGFLILTTIIGFGGALYVTPQSVMAVDKGGNMAALLLAQLFGGGAGTFGGDAFFAFVSAVAFSTILAVVSGLVLASSAAIAHDVYVNVIKDGNANQRQQVTVARITSLVVGLTATWLGVVCENAPIAQLVSLAFAVAASTNLPVIFFSLFWKRFNAAGIISGLVVGFVVAIGLTLVSPNMTYPKKIAADARKMVDVLEKKQASGAVLNDKELKTLEKARDTYAKNKDGKSLLGLDAPLFPLKNPGIVSVPAGFLAAIIGCLAFRCRRAEDMFDELYVRQNTGIGMMKAVDH